jgi:hypothetical protein
MKRLWKQRPVVVGTFILATVLTLFFAGRLVTKAIYWSDPAHQNQEVQGWMTVGYVARSWGVDPSDIDAWTGLPRPEKGRPKTLADIAQDRGVPIEQIITEVEAALAVLIAQEPPR